MIVGVCEEFHDHEPRLYMIDTEKLNKEDYIDRCLLESINQKEEICFIDARDWYDKPEFGGKEPIFSRGAEVEGEAAVQLIRLVICFE